jgi:hypothetical protein
VRLDFRRETGGFFLPGRIAIPARRGLILRHFRKARGLGGMRLTADGQLRNCLFSTSEYDLMPALRGGA